MKLSKFTVFFSIYVVVSSFFMQQVWATWRAMLGVNLLILFLALLGLVAILAILYKSIKFKLNAKKIALISAVCLWAFIFAWKQPYISEKAHVLEFGLLGWLAMRDLTKQSQGLSKRIFKALVFIALIGISEEGLQKFLPWRVCEIRDMITDITSGAFGITLFIFSNPKVKDTQDPLS